MRKMVSLLCLMVAACSATPGPTDVDSTGTPTPEATTPAASPTPNPTPATLGVFTVVSFNTGTSESMGHDNPPDDGYTGVHATTSDTYYGDGLAWIAAVEATTTFLATVQPDIIGFQEIFYSELCSGIPDDQKTDFICESWNPGDPTVANVILGAGYQVMCHPGKDDKCLGVKKSFGTFQGCEEDFCLEGMEGYAIDGCSSSGARVGRAVIDLWNGGTMTAVNYHGSSGFTGEDSQCRVKQVDQVFVDIGNGSGPSASGTTDIVVVGDLNTDPGRAAFLDPSAARWLDFVNLPGETDHDFSFISDIGSGATPTYANLANIDHVMANTGSGSCWSAGIDGNPAVLEAVYFDHMPLVCELEIE